MHRVNLLSCPFDAISFDEAVARIRRAVVTRRRLQVVPGNVDFVMKARRDPTFAAELRRADLIVADGQFIVWAATLLGTPLRGRVSGTELVWACARISEENDETVALVGAGPGVADRAARAMRLRFPGARLVPVATPFPLQPKDNEELLDRLRGLDARIVLVALGAPRQERWIQANLGASGADVGIGVGSAFDIISGDMPRAPEWMQRLSLEWLHRLWLEPGRLWRRYLVEDSPFVIHLARAVLSRDAIGLLRVQAQQPIDDRP